MDYFVQLIFEYVPDICFQTLLMVFRTSSPEFDEDDCGKQAVEQKFFEQVSCIALLLEKQSNPNA